MQYPDTRGLTNGEYRKARGLDKLFDENPTAYAAILRARRQAERLDIAKKIKAGQRRAKAAAQAKQPKRKVRRATEKRRKELRRDRN